MLGYPFALRCDTLDMVDLGCVRELLSRRLQQPFQNLGVSPRPCPSPRAMYVYICMLVCKAQHGFSLLPKACSPYSTSTSALRVFLRFCSGGHELPSNLGRRTGVPRLQRFCTKCAARTIGDAYHLVFKFSAVQCVRDKSPQLFPPLVQTMQQFFWQEDMQSVVHFIQECLCLMLPATVAASIVDDSSDRPDLAGTDVTPFLPSCDVYSLQQS